MFPVCRRQDVVVLSPVDQPVVLEHDAVCVAPRLTGQGDGAGLALAADSLDQGGSFLYYTRPVFICTLLKK